MVFSIENVLKEKIKARESLPINSPQRAVNLQQEQQQQFSCTKQRQQNKYIQVYFKKEVRNPLLQ